MISLLKCHAMFQRGKVTNVNGKAKQLVGHGYFTDNGINTNLVIKVCYALS